MTKTTLIVEPSRHHGQLLHPLIRTFGDLGSNIVLSMNAEHPELKQFQTLSEVNERLETWPVQLESPYKTWQWSRKLRKIDLERVIITTLYPEHWHLPVIVSLRGTRPSLTIHNTNRFPLSCSRDWRSVVKQVLVRLTTKNFMTLMPGLKHGPSEPSTSRIWPNFKVFTPLLGQEYDVIDTPFENGEPTTIVCPGSVSPLRRDYESLVCALAELPKDLPVRIKLVGSSISSAPDYLARLRVFAPQVQLELHDWLTHDEFLSHLMDAHFILPLAELGKGKSYNVTCTASAFFFAHGLARPMLLDNELAYPFHHFENIVSYQKKELAAGIQAAVNSMRNGLWQKLRENSLALRSHLWSQNLALFGQDF